MTIGKILDLIYIIAKLLEKLPEMWRRFQLKKKDANYNNRLATYRVVELAYCEAYLENDVKAQLEALAKLGN